MQRLIQGIHQFQGENFRPLQGLFEQFSKGQNPETLFITCSDFACDFTNGQFVSVAKYKPSDNAVRRRIVDIIPIEWVGLIRFLNREIS